MGIMVSRVHFDGGAPPVDSVIAQVRELTGLEIMTRENASRHHSAKSFELRFAFACAPASEVLVYAYDRSASQGLDTEVRTRMGPAREGMDEGSGTQVIYLRIFVGQEPTLLHATECALERMGGRLERELTPKQRADSGRLLTEAEVVRRVRHAGVMWAAIMVVAVPLGILGIPLLILSTFWRVSRGHKKAERARTRDA